MHEPLCPSVFSQLLKETLAPIPDMQSKPPPPSANDRAEMSDWFRRAIERAMERHGVVIMPMKRTKANPDG